MRLVLFFIGLLALMPCAAAPAGLQRLLENPPFGATGPGAAGAPSEAGAALEFRGVAHEPDGAWFSLYDPGTRRSFWVRQDEPGTGPVVRSFDPQTQSVAVEHNGKAMRLTLKRAPQMAAPPGVPAVAPPVVVGGPMPVPLPAGATAGVSQPVDAERLQQIVEEIRRRRAIRQQAVPPSERPIHPQRRPESYP